jgi:hypothetical protein
MLLSTLKLNPISEYSPTAHNTLTSTAPSVSAVIRHERNRMNSAATVISRIGGVKLMVLAMVTRL